MCSSTSATCNGRDGYACVRARVHERVAFGFGFLFSFFWGGAGGVQAARARLPLASDEEDGAADVDEGVCAHGGGAEISASTVTLLGQRVSHPKPNHTTNSGTDNIVNGNQRSPPVFEIVVDACTGAVGERGAGGDGGVVPSQHRLADIKRRWSRCLFWPLLCASRPSSSTSEELTVSVLASKRKVGTTSDPSQNRGRTLNLCHP